MLIAHRFEHRVGSRLRRLEMYGNRAVAPRIVELVTAIRDKQEIDAELSSGLVEAARLVAEFGGEEQESRHCFYFQGFVNTAATRSCRWPAPLLAASSKPGRARQTVRGLARRSSTTVRLETECRQWALAMFEGVG